MTGGAGGGGEVGLCRACRHHRSIVNRRGSVFHLCQRARTDQRFPRYPRLPVWSCEGYEPVERHGTQSDVEET